MVFVGVTYVGDHAYTNQHPLAWGEFVQDLTKPNLAERKKAKQPKKDDGGPITEAEKARYYINKYPWAESAFPWGSNLDFDEPPSGARAETDPEAYHIQLPVIIRRCLRKTCVGSKFFTSKFRGVSNMMYIMQQPHP